jgi:hypothetical protein
MSAPRTAATSLANVFGTRVKARSAMVKRDSTIETVNRVDIAENLPELAQVFGMGNNYAPFPFICAHK